MLKLKDKYTYEQEQSYLLVDQVLLEDDKILGRDETIEIPLQFWFCSTQSLSLPFIALKCNKVDIELNFNLNSYSNELETKALTYDEDQVFDLYYVIKTFEYFNLIWIEDEI